MCWQTQITLFACFFDTAWHWVLRKEMRIVTCLMMPETVESALSEPVQWAELSEKNRLAEMNRSRALHHYREDWAGSGVSDGIHPLLVHQGDAHGFPDFLEGLQHLSNQNQIKSKSNHFYCHITTAQVPWWVKFLRACSRQCKKQQFTYGQYIFTDCTEDNVQNTHTYTQYT